jgi:hypothetical protein
LIPNPIRKVLSTIRAHQVKALLMGGQACVFYGAAEFSRDTDLAILADGENLARLQSALDELQAELIAVPSFDPAYLHAGHAIHFRCFHPEAFRMRVDVMSKMRGVAAFDELWQRRTTVEMADGTLSDLLSLPDLVLAKKTQCDKDWPMIRRLIEAHYFTNRGNPNPEQITFWLQELRTPSLLIGVAEHWPDQARAAVGNRLLIAHALVRDEAMIELALIELALIEEEAGERQKDRNYWLPLKRELERLRMDR